MRGPSDPCIERILCAVCTLHRSYSEEITKTRQGSYVSILELFYLVEKKQTVVQLSV